MRRTCGKATHAIMAALCGFAFAAPSAAQSAQCSGPDCAAEWRWSAYAGALLLQPMRPSPAALATAPTGTPAVMVDASHFRPGHDIVPEIVLRSGYGAWGVEGRYFGQGTGTASATVSGVTSFRTAGIGVTILGGGDIVTRHATRLRSGELQATYRLLPGITALAGVRWIELRDRFHSDISTPATYVDWNDRNRLLGAQVGGDFAFSSPEGAVQLNLLVKAGVYRNKARQAFTSTLVSGDSDAASPTTFGSEVGVGVSWRVASQIALRAGYSALWLDKVALAGEGAAAATQEPGGTSSPIRTDSISYEGLSLGVEYRL